MTTINGVVMTIADAIAYDRKQLLPPIGLVPCIYLCTGFRRQKKADLTRNTPYRKIARFVCLVTIGKA